MSYKTKATNNRDALFGPPSGSSSGGSKPPSTIGTNSAVRPRTTPPQSDSNSKPSSSSSESRMNTLTGSTNSSSRRGKTKGVITTLSGSAKVAKMKEAEKFRDDAKKAMSKGLFSKPDPIRAGSYYKRAADAYKSCGENRLERLHRIASADCQLLQESYPTAASEFTRAAELSAQSDESTLRKQKEVYTLHKNAADAWSHAGEKGRAGESLMKAAFGLLIDVDERDVLDKKTLTAMEEAIEHFVPDLLNRHAKMRRTGSSTFTPTAAADGAPAMSEEEAMEIAKESVVKNAYGHENVQMMMNCLVVSGEFHSALYAVGAFVALLEGDGLSTITLSRGYVTETIIQLALGDVVAANQTFMNTHLQNNNYLSSRECKLGEDLIRSIRMYDNEALQECQSDRTLANLDPSVRELVQKLRISGAAAPSKKKTQGVGSMAPLPKMKPSSTAVSGRMSHSVPSTMRTSPEKDRGLGSKIPALAGAISELGEGDEDEDEGVGTMTPLPKMKPSSKVVPGRMSHSVPSTIRTPPKLGRGLGSNIPALAGAISELGEGDEDEDALTNEMDALMESMGLDDDDTDSENGVAGRKNVILEEEEDEDDIDLR